MCWYFGCIKCYIYEYKLNFYLWNLYVDENFEFGEELIGRGDSDGEDDIDDGSM